MHLIKRALLWLASLCEPVPSFPKTGKCCCGSKSFVLLESIMSRRDVEGWDDNTLLINGHYELENDGCEDYVIQCGRCYKQYAMPADVYYG